MRGVVLKEVTRSFNGTTACFRVSLSIQEGEFFTFLGPSGCGKTTLLRLIAGFVEPEEGSILLGGKDITRLAAEKRKVGMVFQNYALFPFLTVYENVAYGLKIRKWPSVKIGPRVDKYLELVGLRGLGRRNIDELSGGEQQRVALARSLATEPKVLLLDEPLSNLDARLRDRMRGEIKSLQRELGITTIFVTHDQTEALTMSDRIAVFDRGRCIQVGSPEEIYSHPRNVFVAGFVGETNLFKVHCRDGIAFVSEEIGIDIGELSPGKFLSFRPQDVEISKAKKQQGNTFAGRVVSSQVNGVVVDYIVEVHEVRVRATVLNTYAERERIVTGDEVYLCIDRGCIRMLDE